MKSESEIRAAVRFTRRDETDAETFSRICAGN